jgi:hypothetical protein
LIEGVEVVFRGELKTDPEAFGIGSLPEHHGVMVEGAGQKHRASLLGDQAQSKNLRVVIRLPLNIRRLVCDVRDLSHADHLESSDAMPLLARMPIRVSISC